MTASEVNPQANSTRVSVYLAGGFHSGWQDIVKSAAAELKYFDPREHGLEDPKDYTVADLEGIGSSDWLFAYLENSNPAGYALALEIGYAKALTKRSSW